MSSQAEVVLKLSGDASGAVGAVNNVRGALGTLGALAGKGFMGAAAIGAIGGIAALAAGLGTAVIGFKAIKVGAQIGMKAVQVFATTYAGFVNDAIQVERLGTTFGRLVEERFGQTKQTVLDAVRVASRGTLDMQTIFQQSNKAIMMGMVKNTDQLTNYIEGATQLGAALGLDSVTAMTKWTQMWANRSIRLADDFGFNISRLFRDRIAFMGSIGGEMAFRTKEDMSTALTDAGSVVDKYADKLKLVNMRIREETDKTKGSTTELHQQQKAEYEEKLKVAQEWYDLVEAGVVDPERVLGQAEAWYAALNVQIPELMAAIGEQMDNTLGDIDRFKAGWKDLGIELGKPWLGTVDQPGALRVILQSALASLKDIQPQLIGLNNAIVGAISGVAPIVAEIIVDLSVRLTDYLDSGNFQADLDTFVGKIETGITWLRDELPGIVDNVLRGVAVPFEATAAAMGPASETIARAVETLTGTTPGDIGPMDAWALGWALVGANMMMAAMSMEIAASQIAAAMGLFDAIDSSFLGSLMKVGADPTPENVAAFIEARAGGGPSLGDIVGDFVKEIDQGYKVREERMDEIKKYMQDLYDQQQDWKADQVAGRKERDAERNLRDRLAGGDQGADDPAAGFGATAQAGLEKRTAGLKRNEQAYDDWATGAVVAEKKVAKAVEATTEKSWRDMKKGPKRKAAWKAWKAGQVAESLKMEEKELRGLQELERKYRVDPGTAAGPSAADTIGALRVPPEGLLGDFSNLEVQGQGVGTALVTGITTALTGAGDILTGIFGAGDTTGATGFGQVMAQSIQEQFTLIGPEIQTGLQTAVTGLDLQPAFTTMFSGLGLAITTELALIGPQITTGLTMAFMTASTSLQPIISTMFTGIGLAITQALALIGPQITMGLTMAFAAASMALQPIFITMFAGLAPAIQLAVSQASLAFAGLTMAASMAAMGVSTAMMGIGAAVSAAVSAVASGISGMISSFSRIASAAASASNSASSSFRRMGSAASSAGSQIASGMARGAAAASRIGSAFSSAASAVASACARMVSSARSAAAALSSIKVPSAITQASPSPLERGLLDAARAMDILSTQSVPRLSSAMATTNNFSMTIHTNASHEPIMADYAIMQAMAGG